MCVCVCVCVCACVCTRPFIFVGVRGLVSNSHHKMRGAKVAFLSLVVTEMMTFGTTISRLLSKRKCQPHTSQELVDRVCSKIVFHHLFDNVISRTDDVTPHNPFSGIALFLGFKKK